MEVQLTIEQPGGAAAEHRFTEEPVTLGSALANHIVIEDADLAPHQLIIFREKGDWVIRNLADGVEIICNEQPLGKAETRPLGHEARLNVGSYRVLWCSEAATDSAPKELARPTPSVREIPPPEESRRAAPPPERVVEPVAAPSAKMSEDGPTEPGWTPFSSTVAEEAASLFAGISSPAEESAEPAPAAPAPIETPATRVPRHGAEAVGPPPARHAPEPVIGSASELDLSQLEAAIKAESRTVVTLPEAPGSVDLEAPEPAAAPRRRPASTSASRDSSRVTVHGYGRMRPFRAYPLLVNVTQGERAARAADAASFVRVVPCFPGCVVTPTSARLDLSRTANGMKFWVTPVAVGRHRDAWVDITWQGGPPARLKMPCRVLTPWMSRLFLFLASMAAALAFLPGFMRWEVKGALERRLPAELAPHAVKVLETAGGVVNVGLAVAALLLLMSVVSYLLRRPRSVTLTATRPGA